MVLFMKSLAVSDESLSGDISTSSDDFLSQFRVSDGNTAYPRLAIAVSQKATQPDSRT